MTDLLYINAYSVTRHYGGHEEGGWWFNAGEPLASIPIRAKRVQGHGSWCGNCSDAAAGNGEFCKKYLPDDEEYEEGLDNDEEYWDRETREVQHLKPLDTEEKERYVAHLRSVFADYNEGNIYSVLGGAELQVYVEDHAAENFPQEMPRYC